MIYVHVNMNFEFAKFTFWQYFFFVIYSVNVFLSDLQLDKLSPVETFYQAVCWGTNN